MLQGAPPGPGPEEKDEGRSGDSVTGSSDGHGENRSQQMLGSSLGSAAIPVSPAHCPLQISEVAGRNELKRRRKHWKRNE